MQTDNANLKGTTEIKQAFLASAISDISSYIQLSDTKVSIIMAAMVALVAAVVSCYEPILCALDKIKPCSWVGVAIVIFSTLFFYKFCCSICIWYTDNSRSFFKYWVQVKVVFASNNKRVFFRGI